MAYELFFQDTGWRALGLRMSREDWKLVSITSPEKKPSIEAFLGKKLRWHQPESGKLGYGGCATVEVTSDPVEVLFVLHSRNVRASMLTLSFLLQDIERSITSRLPTDSWYSRLHIGCGHEFQNIFGDTSDTFRKGIALLDENDLNDVSSDMIEAWKAVAPRNLKRCADQCYARVRDGLRFELGCFGNACDVSVYPDSDPMFSCHNLDTPYQQATLLVGLASLHHVVKGKV